MNAWRVEPIGELFNIGAGKSVTPSARLGDRPYPFLRTANVFWGRIDVSRVDAMNFSDNEIAQKSLRPGDLLVCEGGDIGRAAIWRGELANCGFQNHLHRLRAKSARISPLFAMFYLEAAFTQLGIFEGAGNKTTIPNLSRNRLAALEIPVPTVEEQRRIAAILWKVQRAIEVQEQLVATVRELKQAAMRQLFTHGLRGEAQKETEIGMVPESWVVNVVGSHFTLTAGGTPSRSEARFWDAGTIPWVKTGEVDYADILNTEEKITNEGLQHSAAKIIPAGTVLVAMYGQGITRGKVAILAIDAATNQACVACLPRYDSSVTPRFLYYVLQGSYERLRSLAHGGQQQNLNKDLVAGFPIPVPSTLPEQHEIATALQTIDRKLAHHERKRDTLQELFKTLLHELMTGRIRVHELDIDITTLAGESTGGAAT